jgi:hypothetical protein
MKAYGRVDIQIHIFLTSALAGGEWSATRPCRFIPRGDSSRYTMDRRLGGTQSRSDDMEKRRFLTILEHELQSRSRPARN